MARTKQQAAEALQEQSRALVGWLQELPEAAFAGPTVLPEWDVRHLTGHLVLVHEGFTRLLDRPTPERGLPPYELVRRYRRDVDLIRASTEDATGDRSGPELVERLQAAIEALGERLADPAGLPLAVSTPRGPSTVEDFLATRIVEVVVHADDLSRSLPDRTPVPLLRGALGRCSRTLATILAGQHPGRSVEVRIPPYAAVQCAVGDPGPTHTRGTPPNVVETDAVTFLRLATGRVAWSEPMRAGLIRASGLRADLTPVLPLLS
ncbi:MAG: hypothetical protein JWP61_891 [Friedmanniella sp.]|nr:hypothetical protein [Friedmanniella sp.]